MNRDDVHQSSVQGDRRSDYNRWNYFVNASPKIGYARLTQFTPDSYRDLRSAMESMLSDGMKGFVLDLRFDGGGELDQAEQIINMLIPKGGRSSPPEAGPVPSSGQSPTARTRCPIFRWSF